MRAEHQVERAFLRSLGYCPALVERAVTALAGREDHESAASPRVLRFGEAAARLGVSTKTVRTLCLTGSLARLILPGRVRALGVAEAGVAALVAGGGARHDGN
jgi:hypothetical protein